MMACISNNIEMVTTLIERGANTTERHYRTRESPLMLVCGNDANLDIARILIPYYSIPELGEALVIATRNWNRNLISLLISKNAKSSTLVRGRRHYILALYSLWKCRYFRSLPLFWFLFVVRSNREQTHTR
jgi:ankyrin repeat protein